MLDMLAIGRAITTCRAVVLKLVRPDLLQLRLRAVIPLRLSVYADSVMPTQIGRPRRVRAPRSLSGVALQKSPMRHVCNQSSENNNQNAPTNPSNTR